jgi:hypothetical protein
MAKLKGAAKQAFLARMAKGRAKKGGGGKKHSSGSAMVPYTAMPMMGYSGAAPSAPKRSVRQKLTSVLELAAKKQSMITSLGAGALLGYADHEGWLQELPEIDSVNGLDNKFTLAAGLYFLADSDLLASMPKVRLFAQDVANVSAGIGAYNATRVYLGKKDKAPEGTTAAPAAGLGYRHREEF